MILVPQRTSRNLEVMALWWLKEDPVALPLEKFLRPPRFCCLGKAQGSECSSGPERSEVENSKQSTSYALYSSLTPNDTLSNLHDSGTIYRVSCEVTQMLDNR